ncbi:hypothetical protein JTB14_020710 [Gonioctena quinquepunctata]|nr:hypothetical protein JTB14_020710 [Gonioctena quinquepunctata]
MNVSYHMLINKYTSKKKGAEGTQRKKTIRPRKKQQCDKRPKNTQTLDSNKIENQSKTERKMFLELLERYHNFLLVEQSLNITYILCIERRKASDTFQLRNKLSTEKQLD